VESGHSAEQRDAISVTSHLMGGGSGGGGKGGVGGVGSQGDSERDKKLKNLKKVIKGKFTCSQYLVHNCALFLKHVSAAME